MYKLYETRCKTRNRTKQDLDDLKDYHDDATRCDPSLLLREHPRSTASRQLSAFCRVYARDVHVPGRDSLRGIGVGRHRRVAPSVDGRTAQDVSLKLSSISTTDRRTGIRLDISGLIVPEYELPEENICGLGCLLWDKVRCILEEHVGPVTFLVDNTSEGACVIIPRRGWLLREALDTSKRRVLNCNYWRGELVMRENVVGEHGPSVPRCGRRPSSFPE